MFFQMIFSIKAYWYLVLASLLFSIEKYETAVKFSNLALQANSNFDKAWYARGEALKKLERY